ncbi:MAG: hypothetical protein KatS3mg060_2297 [Dehalococcoidia bacterium]|nr:MAG: hypothetical protein KatS3mg060_2297 [Dehalococcoidia bacterium]
MEPIARRLGLQNRLDLVELDAPLAFCYGYLRPRVLVSTGLLKRLAGPELEALLLHEREHLRQRDPLKVALGRLLASALFFVPIVGALYHRYLVEKELAADGAAIAERGDPTDLSAALVRLVEGGGLRQSVPGIGAGEALEARIDALLGEPVKVGLPLGPGGFAASTIAAILAALPLVAAPPPLGPWWSLTTTSWQAATCALAVARPDPTKTYTGLPMAAQPQAHCDSARGRPRQPRLLRVPPIAGPGGVVDGRSGAVEVLGPEHVLEVVAEC